MKETKPTMKLLPLLALAPLAIGTPALADTLWERTSTVPVWQHTAPAPRRVAQKPQITHAQILKACDDYRNLQLMGMNTRAIFQGVMWTGTAEAKRQVAMIRNVCPDVMW